jgi:hypothetical protein
VSPRGRPTTPVSYQCTACGKTQPIARKKGYQRRGGHLKRLWCTDCRATTNHAQEDGHE